MKKYKEIGLRLPVKTRIGKKIHARIVAAAKANGRSMNSEIVARLIESFDRETLTAEVAATVRQTIIESMAAKVAGH